MTAAPDELQALVEKALRDRRIATADELGATATLWLAAAPVWTRSAAEAVSFPVESVTDFVRRACEAGWCETRGSARGQGSRELRFWMPDAVRREVIGAVISRVGYESAAQEVTGIAIDLAPRLMLRAQFPDVQSPGALRAWTDLVGHVNAGERVGRLNVVSAATRLVEQAQQAVEAGDLALAQDLVEAGEALAAVFGGTAEQALSRARRLLALGLQRRQDDRTLERYLDRPELTDSITRLLQPQAPPWALHLRGVGGVGKTMLIRYLASGRYAREHGRPAIPIARADFDHISPDYPVRRPVQLLLELADELALHTAGNHQADQALTAFRARAARAHEAASGLREAGVPPLGNPEVARAVDDFGTVLKSLGGVLLILDTCEELAKADMGNPAAPAVRATLDILERLHQKAPSARVLFAGRRPLPERGYLVVQPVTGFTVAEARRYLAREYGTRRNPDAQGREPATARPLPPELADAMIRQSPAVDGPVPAQGQLPERVSPFDLALYAAWADEDPELSVAQVDRGSDAYIEGRIIERLDDPLVVRALPVVASAGRCRVATIAEFLNCDAATLGRNLAAQEWIDAAGSPANGTGHVAATPALARRLRRYFGKDERRAEFTGRNTALASFLLPRLRDTPLAGIDVDELIAALRLSTPAEAAALWDSIADRAMEPPGRWGTVLNMTRRILGEWEPRDWGHSGWGHREWERDTWPTMPALRATVTAAHIAGSRRHSPLFDAQSHWGIVLRWAGRHPDPHERRILMARATLGLLPDKPDDDWLWAAIRDPATSPPACAESTVATLDAVHRLLEAGQYDAAARLDREVGLIAGTMPNFAGRAIVVWTQIARARLHADERPSHARSWLESAEAIAASAREPEPAWPDWIAPDDLLARARIERGLIAPPDDLSVLDEWEAYAADHLDTIDGERLASLCLRIRLRHGVVDASAAQRWESLDAYTPDRAATCSAHDLVPPLCVSVAEAWMSAGQPDRALDLLGRRRSEARGTRLDETTVRHADAATVKIVRRLRLETQLSLLYGLGSVADPNLDRWQLGMRYEAWRATSVVHQQPPDLTRLLRSGELPPAAWHAWWQSQIGNWQAAPIDVFLGPTIEAPPFGPSIPADPARIAQLTLDDADLVADLEEMFRLGHPGLIGREHAMDVVLSGRASARPQARSAEPYYDVRAAMRRAALKGGEFTPRPGIPPRLLAEMAFEEAELTELRLPAIATGLYDIAARAYNSAGDQVWYLLARASQVATMTRPDSMLLRVTSAALSTLREQNPVLAAKLTGPVEDAGRWGYWAQRVGQPVALATPQITDPGETAQPPGSGSGPSLPPGSTAEPPAVTASHAATPWTRGAYLAVAVFLLALAGLSVAALTGSPIPVLSTSSPSNPTTPHAEPHASHLPIAIVAVIGVLIILLAWRIPKLRLLAARRGVGASRLETLMFDARLEPPGGGSIEGTIVFKVGLRPARSAPLRTRVLIRVLEPAAWAVNLPWRRAYGYVGSLLTQDPSALLDHVAWGDPRPAASPRWWRKGRATAAGIIRHDWSRADPRYLAAPWERILPASLASDAAGRIEWLRIFEGAMHTSATHTNIYGPPLDPKMSGPQQVLQGPSNWTASLGDNYLVVSGPSLRPLPPELPLAGYVDLQHMIGRAVSTAAGPAMDISDAFGLPPGSSDPGGRYLLGVQEITHKVPRLVILQAEPTGDEVVGTDPPADQPEKLALAAELVTDGVPAVLLLPEVPAGIAGDIARAVNTYPTVAQGDAQRLLVRLRTIIAPHVPPQVLDDIVLFLNERMYRQ
jgi:hypothetical protein